MDSSHVWMLGRENAVSSKHASAELPQPTAALMCKPQQPPHPSCMSLASRTSSLLPLPPHRSPLAAPHRFYLLCPVRSSRAPNFSRASPAPCGAQVPPGWLSLLLQARDAEQGGQSGPLPELCVSWGALRTFSGPGILPPSPRRTWARER